MKVWNVAFIVRKLASILQQLHRKKIIHRDINTKSISLKFKTSTTSISPTRATKNNSFNQSLKLQISDFDLAFCFKKDAEEVNQTFNIPTKLFAPEIEANESHGCPVDVWGLGQITNRLLEKTMLNNAKLKTVPSADVNL